MPRAGDERFQNRRQIGKGRIFRRQVEVSEQDNVLFQGGSVLDRRRAGGGIRRCCLNPSGGEVEALWRRGSRWGDQGWLSRQADAVEVANAVIC